VYQIYGALFTALNTSAEFRLRFADRMQKHFFNGGALAKEVYNKTHADTLAQVDPIRLAIIGDVRKYEREYLEMEGRKFFELKESEGELEGG